MDIIKFSIRNPVTVMVGVILVVLFGLVSLSRIPVQLSPNVEEPTISVRTIWPGATPYEIERDILEEQEKVLKGIPGLYEMEGTARNGSGAITLRFRIGTDLDGALLRVSNKLSEVRSYPENVERPVINASGAEASPIAWVILRTKENNPNNIWHYKTFLEDEVRQYFDRIDGVADLFIGGGGLTEMHVKIDPSRLASYRLTLDQVVAALRAGNANISAGNLDVDRREYRIRTVAEYRNEADIKQVVISSDGQRIVRVGDVADVEFGFERLTVPMLTSGAPEGRRGISIGVRPEPNTNILELTDRVEVVVNELNEGLLAHNDVYLEIVSEQRPYIRGAIDLLRQNIAIGGTLAVLVLLLYLRSLAPTIVVSTAIPISIIGTFMGMYAAGSSLNVVSLAGIAFAVGMLVDNAIVVLENIDRHKSMGKTPFRAAYDGTTEVWGAVLASSLTTVAVFLPVVFLADEAGQLFRDIALAVSCAVMLSLVVSMTVIPMFSNLIYRLTHRGDAAAGDATTNEPSSEKTKKSGKKRFRNPLLYGAGKFVGGVMLILRGLLFNWATRTAAIVVLVSAAVFTGWLLMPKMEYLPEGNRDLIINVVITPPGLSFEERREIGEQLIGHIHPYTLEAKDGYPKVRRMFFVGREQALILGVLSEDQARTRELIPLCREAVAQIPGVFGISNQASIFQSGLGQGRTITVDLSGDDINEIVASAGAMFGRIRGAIEDVQVRPTPSLDLLFPEVNFIPNRERLQAVGMTAEQFGIGLDVLMDGRKIGEFKEEGKKKIDLLLKSGDYIITGPEDLANALLYTRNGEAVPVSSLAHIEEDAGLTEIRHLERDRTISLQVTPPATVTLQETMEIINEQIVPEMQEAALLEGIRVGMSGTADRLTETRQALQWNFLLAAGISYLLMSALLGNFLYPFIIMFTVPLAAAGGLIGLNLVSNFIAPQQLDILTMLGFIILVGIVVNNAILIVYQSLQNVRYEGMEHKEAILEAARTRLRPIYMSATTSLCGMLPLVLWPGPGSELYRGLGAVVLGGLALSTIITVFLIPCLLMFVIGWEKPREAEED